MTVNFGNVSNDYAKYRDHLPQILFDQLMGRGIQFKDKKIIDLGSGSGIFSRDLVKHGARVIGIEPSKELIEKAVLQDRSAGIDSIQYVHATAEQFSLNGNAPIITAVRAWHWFNRLEVLANINNYLSTNGLLIIINSIFLPSSEVAKTTFEVLRGNKIEMKPAGSNAEVKERRSGFPVNWFKEWEDHSFFIIEEWQEQYDLDFTHDEWCGKIRSVSWMTNVSEETRIRVTDELKMKLQDYDDILTIPHQLSVVVLNHRSGSYETEFHEEESD